ncbi:MAG: molybdate ABC transporter substrate-binding protein [Eubacteriaceae bacterium]|nr:molybdate ABC transporter substrate-binding protein [Eubacteriaceae bacterium]
MKLKNLFVFMALTGVLFTAGCSNTPAKKVDLTISAAASLKDAMGEITELYMTENSNVTITTNFGSAGALEQQIEQGADVDVFVSAAQKQMDALADKDLLQKDTRIDLLGNKLVLIVPKDNTEITGFEDLTEDSVKAVAMGEIESVPVGQYAQDTLTSLGLLDQIAPKAVYGKDVKTVLNWVETGNADAGIVYFTDAEGSDLVKIAATASEDTHKPIVYPAAVINTSTELEASKAFLDFLSSHEAVKIFEKYGFEFKG